MLVLKAVYQGIVKGLPQHLQSFLITALEDLPKSSQKPYSSCIKHPASRVSFAKSLKLLIISLSNGDILLCEISFEIVDWIINNKPVPVAQTGKVVNFERRKPYQSEITEPSNIKELYDFIRMLDAESYPQAFINYNNFKIEFSKAEVQGDTLEASVHITLRSNGDE